MPLLLLYILLVVLALALYRSLSVKFLPHYTTIFTIPTIPTNLTM
jgi:hypothetical protein